MILDLFSSTEYIIHILSLFKEYAAKNNLSLEIQNTYNNPFMDDVRFTLENLDTKNLTIINFNSFSNLGIRELRSIDTNEFNLSFTLFFLSTEAKEKTSFRSSLLNYELFNEFLYENRFSFFLNKYSKDISINIFINQTNPTVLDAPKKVILSSEIGSNTFFVSSSFNSSFKVLKKPKGGHDA